MSQSNAFTLYSLDGAHSATYQHDSTSRRFDPDNDASASFAMWLNTLLQTTVITDVAAFCATYGVSAEPIIAPVPAGDTGTGDTGDSDTGDGDTGDSIGLDA